MVVAFSPSYNLAGMSVMLRDMDLLASMRYNCFNTDIEPKEPLIHLDSFKSMSFIYGFDLKTKEVVRGYPADDFSDWINFKLIYQKDSIYEYSYDYKGYSIWDKVVHLDGILDGIDKVTLLSKNDGKYKWFYIILDDIGYCIGADSTNSPMKLCGVSDGRRYLLLCDSYRIILIDSKEPHYYLSNHNAEGRVGVFSDSVDAKLLRKHLLFG